MRGGDRATTFVVAVLLCVGFLAAVVQTFSQLSSGAIAALLVAVLLLIVLVGGYVLVGRYSVLRAKDKRYAHEDSRKLYAHMQAEEFEHHVAWVFEKDGYVAEVTSYQKDHGIDIVLYKGGKRFAVQVKKYGLHNPVTEAHVRDFYGSIANLGYTRGYLVTSGRFTREALLWAQPRALTLVHGAELMERVEGVRPFTARELWHKVLRRW